MTGRGQTRRFLLQSAAVAGGGFALGVALPGRDAEARRASDQAADPEITAWIVIRPDEQVVIRVARAEVGQGTSTGLAQLVAEELDCDWARVRVEPADPAENIARQRVFREFATSASRGVRGSQDYMRQAGATARAMLLEAAAELWKVPATDLTVDKGIVQHKASRRSTSYGKLAPLAAQRRAPDPRLIRQSEPKDWSLAGKPLRRLDTPEKLDGRAVYGIDVKLPGMLVAAIRDAPVFGAKLKSFDGAAAKIMPGVQHVLQVGETAIAVVADSWWQAKTALDYVVIEWQAPPDTRSSSQSIADYLKEGLDTKEAFIGTTHGDALKAIAGTAKADRSGLRLALPASCRRSNR